MSKPMLSAALLAATLAACKPAPEGPPKVDEGYDAIACALGETGQFFSA